jgi:uncharacterized iron-regulated protein
MKKISIVFIVIFFQTAATIAQNPAYTLFNERGKELKYEKMVKACAEADVVLFGEQHNNPISHWLQLELTQDLFSQIGNNLILGAEMFETDNQLIMDEYFAGMITQKKFEEDTRLWPNYKTDYKPLLEFANDSGLKFIATNIPRRYANMTYKLGLDTLAYLSAEAKKYIAPLPLIYDTTLNCYSSLAGGSPMGGHGSPEMRDAQAIKDATMSHFLLMNLEEDKVFIHYNGAYHSDDFESLNYFLKRANPVIKIVTISTVLQEDISKLSEEEMGLADFIICVPENMTTTY